MTWTSGTYSLTLDIPELIYQAASPAVTGPAGIRYTLNFQAYYGNHADATVLKSTLVNSVSDY